MHIEIATYFVNILVEKRDLTIVIQGPLNHAMIEYYISEYIHYPVVISTWTTSLDVVNHVKLPGHWKVIMQNVPRHGTHVDWKHARQSISTHDGLKLVETRYVVKMRGDEFYSNIDKVSNILRACPDKLHCMPIFFRYSWDIPFHSSDHFYAGTTDNMRLMFGVQSFDILDRATQRGFWRAEQKLTLTYLARLYPEENWLHDTNNKSYKYMNKHFNILDIAEHEPYYITCNIQKWAKWNVVPRNQKASLSKIENDSPVRERTGLYLG